MQTFFLTLVILLIFVAAMSVGVLMGRKPLKGSCGGVGAALKEEDYVCDLCGGDPNKCEEEQQKPAGMPRQKPLKPEELAYDASK
ncbi:(Na+)-NQR maturation NqrM [Aestuariicella hydrocarbonica]|uniref:(Na+)-NQR maturation NqrM n=1 Tax=Pseudomaricurvus hydrocarbonicus TaxID=1470433 RepID=A0A9E5T4I8_9GAMM|nr:(Na+)-NQR maturation NqrM [Aestuariicella hydrocarbonica]NHO68042.1 (Na+)-NQR maturation NqrM [Aestuariicella hydrocarbonica]